MSSYGSDYDGSDYEYATDDFNDACENFCHQDSTSEDGSSNGEEDHECWNGEMDDAFWEAQDMCFE